ncbi:MAG: phage tail protein [Candidatus Nanopelagicaceae bacterium]
MTVFYTNERARYGGVSGTIIPFPVKLPDINVPDQGDWRDLLPAGFLRCDGSILSASEYPILAGVLGVGQNSKFRRPDTELTNNEFQLPDIGSKYIAGSNASGAYLNDKVLNEDSSNPYRVGAEIDVTSLIGDSTTISYSGSFEVVSPGNIEFIGNPQFTTTTSDSRTLKAFLSEQAFQAHGHDADVGVFSYLGSWGDSVFTGLTTGASQGGNDGQNEGSNEPITIQQPTGSSAVVSHGHLLDFPSTTEVNDNNGLRYTFENTEIEAFGLESTVNITTNNIYKLDEATPPFILVEYIIKI